MESKKFIEYMKRSLMKKGADDVIISLNEDDHHQLKFVNNSVSTSKSWKTLNAHVFISVKKRVITTNISLFSKTNADNSVIKLMRLARSMQPQKNYEGIANGPFDYVGLKGNYDKNIAGLREESVDYVKSGINASLNAGADRASGVFEYGSSQRRIITSGNVDAKEKGTHLYFSIRSFSGKEASGHKTFCSRSIKMFNPEAEAKEAGEIAVLARAPKKLGVGRYDILLDQLPFSNMLDQVGNASSIFAVETGLSFLAGKIDQRVGDNSLSVFDDGRLFDGYNSCLFDSEGVPTRKTCLIDKGKLKTYLHNTSSAKRHNTKTTANAGLISPEPWNLVLKPGRYKKERLFNMVKKGIYITNTWYTRFQNYTTGDFSTIPRDGVFLIEDGEIQHPVKGIRLSDNIIRLLKGIKGLGKDTKQICSWENENIVICPLAVIEKANITKST